MTPTGDQRVELLDGSWDDAARSTFEEIRATMGRVPNLHRTLAAAPDLLRAWYRFSHQVRTAPRSGRAGRELAILRVAQLESAEYVWCSHRAAAISAGVDPGLLAGLDGWTESARPAAIERAILQFVDECIGQASVSARTWNDLVVALSLTGALEIAITTCWYLCVSRLTRILQVPLEESHAGVPRP